MLALINNISFVNTLINTRYLSYGLCDSNYARRNNLTRLRITLREVTTFNGKVSTSIREVVVVTLDLDRHREARVFMYVLPIGHYDIILGILWITA